MFGPFPSMVSPSSSPHPTLALNSGWGFRFPLFSLPHSGSCLTLACSFLTRVACLFWASWEFFSFLQEAAWFSTICCCSASTCSSSTSCNGWGFMFNLGLPVSMRASENRLTVPMWLQIACSRESNHWSMCLRSPLELETKTYKKIEKARFLKITQQTLSGVNLTEWSK